jgi:hypothetical protein
MVGIYDFSAGHGQCLRSSEFGHCILQVDVPSSQSWFVLEISETTCGLLEKNQYQANLKRPGRIWVYDERLSRIGRPAFFAQRHEADFAAACPVRSHPKIRN